MYNVHLPQNNFVKELKIKISNKRNLKYSLFPFICNASDAHDASDAHVYLRYRNEVGKQVFLYSFSWNLEELELVVTSMTSVNFG
ncbi:hypothetical protein Avbf_14715 [Armadillidium vulgare]|nr:hypothetical protein Avbf_14715 [Armadillidium vulgare]